MQQTAIKCCKSLRERQCFHMGLPAEGLAELLDASYANLSQGSLVQQFTSLFIDAERCSLISSFPYRQQPADDAVITSGCIA